MSEHATREMGHERRDVSVPLVAGFALGLVVAGAVIYVAVAGFFHVLKGQHPSPDAPSRIAFKTEMLAPPPRLQANPRVDLRAYNAAQADQLQHYGWVDRAAGVAHIPIERAMELVAQRGLPTRGPGTNNASGKTPEQMQHDKAAATAPQNPQ